MSFINKILITRVEKHSCNFVPLFPHIVYVNKSDLKYWKDEYGIFIPKNSSVNLSIREKLNLFSLSEDQFIKLTDKYGQRIYTGIPEIDYEEIRYRDITNIFL